MTNEKILRSCPIVSGQKKKPRRKSFPANGESSVTLYFSVIEEVAGVELDQEVIVF